MITPALVPLHRGAVLDELDLLERTVGGSSGLCILPLASAEPPTADQAIAREIEILIDGPENLLLFRPAGGRIRLDSLLSTIRSFETGLAVLRVEVLELREAEERHARRHAERALNR